MHQESIYTQAQKNQCHTFLTQVKHKQTKKPFQQNSNAKDAKK